MHTHIAGQAPSSATNDGPPLFARENGPSRRVPDGDPDTKGENARDARASAIRDATHLRVGIETPSGPGESLLQGKSAADCSGTTEKAW